MRNRVANQMYSLATPACWSHTHLLAFVAFERGCLRFDMPFIGISKIWKLLFDHRGCVFLSLCRPVCVTLVFSSKGQRYLRVGLAVPLFGSLACLRRMVADEGKISPDQVTGAHTASRRQTSCLQTIYHLTKPPSLPHCYSDCQMVILYTMILKLMIIYIQ